MEIHDYIQDVASAKSAPGGGSVSAYTGALGTALGVMALKISKKKSEQIDIIEEHIAKLSPYITQFESLSPADEAVSERMFQQFRLPKNTEEEKKKRQIAIQEAIEEATKIPLQTMRTAVDVLTEFEKSAPYIHPTIHSDLKVGTYHVHTACLSALENVRVNIELLKDQEKVTIYSRQAEQYLQQTEECVHLIMETL